MKSIGLTSTCFTFVGLVLVFAAGGASRPAISPTSIAGATLGEMESTYKQHFRERAYRYNGTVYDPANPINVYRLVFKKSKLSVYFPANGQPAEIITTWNRAYRTASGIGPCSTISRLRAVYRNRLRPSKFSTQNGVVYSYTVGRNLIFSSNNRKTVEVVGLYDGSAPDWNRPGGSLARAGFITLNETGCS